MQEKITELEEAIKTSQAQIADIRDLLNQLKELWKQS